MIQVLAETKENIIATRAYGKLTDADYKKLLPIMTNALKKFKKICWYFEIVSFEEYQMKAFWDDVKFDLQHIGCYEKIALVCEEKWHYLILRLIRPFIKTEINFFEIDEKDKALCWIKN